jgi:hypothetical protein
MPISIIISYDGTAHDDDSLMLGKMLSAAGASLSLAYVRHSHEYDPRREEIGVHDADRRLEQGALWLEDESIARHVVINPSTGEGLAALAASEGATALLFGSDYRTPPGRVEPGVSAQGLLEGGTVAIGVAAAGLRTRAEPTLGTVSFLSDDPAGTAMQTARSLAGASGAELIAGAHDADLIVVDSRASGPVGTVGLDGLTRGWLDSARGSVLVLPHGTTLAF